MIPSDTITLSGLRIFANHGVLAEEKQNGQEFVVDVVVELDFSEAAATDDVTKTIHYGELAERIVAAVEADTVDLIETVVERIATLVLTYPRAIRTIVTLHKPSAPITVPFDDVAVTITRERR